MKFCKKLFGSWKMDWRKVLLLALLTGLYTGVVMRVAALDGTSFQDIGVNLECWLFFALLIIVNCRKWWEAALKCFLFFLVSQPLVYLVQVPFSAEGWGIFRYYPYWFRVTLLTLPGAAVAFLVKKRNLFSVAVLSVANAYLALQAVQYARSAAASFPAHLLSALFCVALALFFCFVLLDRKPLRIAALAVFAAVLIGCGAYSAVRNSGAETVIPLGPGTWQCAQQEDSLSVEIGEDGAAKLHSDRSGAWVLDFTDENGTMQSYNIVVDGKNVFVSGVD